MYQQFFNFNTAPFSIAPDPHYIYMSEYHQEGLAHLLYGIKHGGGFVALTGEVGTGKTMLCHCLLDELPDDVQIALVLNPKLNTLELLATICDELQIAYDHQHLSIKGLIDNLNKHLLETHAKGWMTVLLIDEAQNLSLDVLEQIRLLTNLETSTSKLLQIILVGQPELKALLALPELRQLNQRITARYHLNPLSYQDTQNYIKHRLKLSGGSTTIFDYGAIKRIYKLSKGIPRLINVLSDRALLGAYVDNTETVTAKIVNRASKEVLAPSVLYPHFSTLKYLSGTLILAGLVLIAFFLLPAKTPKNHVVLSGSFQKPVLADSQQQQKTIEKTENKVIQQTPVLAETPATLDFAASLKRQPLPLNIAISKLAHLWNIQIDSDSGCNEIEQTELRCLLDSSNWKNLIRLNRPVIMEFPINGKEKSYALLLGVKEGNPVFQFEHDMEFPVVDVLALWDGYYLSLWQPPVRNIEIASFGLSSKAVTWIRQQLSSNFDHKLNSDSSVYFDKELKTEVIKFQQNHHLIADGIVGPRTFIHLNNGNPHNKSPKLKLNF